MFGVSSITVDLGFGWSVPEGPVAQLNELSKLDCKLTEELVVLAK